MSSPTPITVAYGDGIGPEIMAATLHILTEAGASLAPEVIEVGEKVYLSGNTAGIDDAAWESLKRTKVFLKAPITTPQGGGYKSLNVTTRKTLGLFANVRPCVSYAPFVATKHPVMDVVVVRENEEDLYAGIEYRLTDEVYQCLKLITRPGCERIVRYAFDYALANGRRKVTCFTKDNIMKLTDGLFHKVFDEVSALPEYAGIEKEHWIVDIGAAKLADTPEAFDVVVMPNLYGDILSDVAAQIAGSVGLAGSANIGTACSMFEAIHGSAPRRAGQNLANPSGLFLGGVMMLVHIGQTEAAERAHNAWLRTIEDGIHTYDIFEEGVSREKVGTKEFAQAVVARLGQMPERLKPASYANAPKAAVPFEYVRGLRSEREMIGVDVYIGWTGDREELAARIQQVTDERLPLTMMSNRGIKVWPGGHKETFCVDEFRCRFVTQPANRHLGYDEMAALLGRLAWSGLGFEKVETLCNYDGQAGYSLAQGQ